MVWAKGMASDATRSRRTKVARGAVGRSTHVPCQWGQWGSFTADPVHGGVDQARLHQKVGEGFGKGG